MSDFSVSGKVQTDEIDTAADFEKIFVKELNSTFNKVKTKNGSNGLTITGRVKTAIFNPIASFKGKLNVSIKNGQCRYIYDGKVSTNGWFWITLLIFMVLFFPLILVIVIMYHKQKNQIIEEMKRLDQRLHFAVDKL